MAHTAAQDSNIPTAGPLFENTCGRRGCVYIFKYAGTDPFQSLAVLVAQHAPSCIGRISAIPSGSPPQRSWLASPTQWTTPQCSTISGGCCRRVRFLDPRQCPPSDVMDVFADSELSDLTDDEATDDDSDYDVTAESIGVPVKRKRKATSTPRTTTTSGSAAMPPPSTPPRQYATQSCKVHSPRN
ncbi:hypothetical protein B0H13DRAFT_2326700 [Mycena leptocephala]|nr:hypothetical protein B0H13DRAFT_2326700 [Mycena leptocephala]